MECHKRRSVDESNKHATTKQRNTNSVEVESDVFEIQAEEPHTIRVRGGWTAYHNARTRSRRRGAIKADVVEHALQSDGALGCDEICEEAGCTTFEPMGLRWKGRKMSRACYPEELRKRSMK